MSQQCTSGVQESTLTFRSAQLVEYIQTGAYANGDIGNVERRPMPSLYKKIQKVDDMPVHQAVDQVADCAAENQSQSPAMQALTWIFFDQIGNQNSRDDGDPGKEVTLPSTLVREKAERGSLVVNQHQIKKGSDGNRLPVTEDLRNGDLGDLVEQHDNGGDSQP